MNTPPQDDKRRFHRVHFVAGSRLSSDGHEQACQLLDISIKGVLVQLTTPTTLQTGQHCNFDLTLSDNETHIAMAVRVAHVHDNRAGFLWERIDADSLTHLRRLLELNLGDADLVERELSQLGS